MDLGNDHQAGVHLQEYVGGRLSQEDDVREYGCTTTKPLEANGASHGSPFPLNSEVRRRRRSPSPIAKFVEEDSHFSKKAKMNTKGTLIPTTKAKPLLPSPPSKRDTLASTSFKVPAAKSPSSNTKSMASTTIVRDLDSDDDDDDDDNPFLPAARLFQISTQQRMVAPRPLSLSPTHPVNPSSLRKADSRNGSNVRDKGKGKAVEFESRASVQEIDSSPDFEDDHDVKRRSVGGKVAEKRTIVQDSDSEEQGADRDELTLRLRTGETCGWLSLAIYRLHIQFSDSASYLSFRS
jgi:hypothetical protein